MTRVGIDIVEIARVERALERRPRLAERLFRPGELEFAAARPSPARHLATRFAAKEASVKALGGHLPLREIEIVGGGEESPAIVLHGAAADLARDQGVALEVSLSHSRELAVAAVVASQQR